MPKYTLKVNFENPDDLQELRKDAYNLLIVKSTGTSATTPVAWQSLEALMQNTIEWEEDYYLYGSETETKAGVTISEFTPTQDTVNFAGTDGQGLLYTFQNGVWSKPAERQMSIGSVMALNSESAFPVLTMGLAQMATVGGQAGVLSPINADPVIRSYSDSLTPHTFVSVFMDRVYNNGVVLTDIQSNHYKVEFGGDANTWTLNYSDGKWSASVN